MSQFGLQNYDTKTPLREQQQQQKVRNSFHFCPSLILSHTARATHSIKKEKLSASAVTVRSSEKQTECLCHVPRETFVLVCSSSSCHLMSEITFYLTDMWKVSMYTSPCSYY